MTKSNNEWVPETLDEVEVWIDNVGYWVKVKVLAVDCGRVVWRNGSDGLSYIGTPLEFVRPIKTEAEKRRDLMLNEVVSSLTVDPASSPLIAATETVYQLLVDGWIKPKPLTEGVITQIWQYHSGLRDCPHFKFAKAIESFVLRDLD